METSGSLTLAKRWRPDLDRSDTRSGISSKRSFVQSLPGVFKHWILGAWQQRRAFVTIQRTQDRRGRRGTA